MNLESDGGPGTIQSLQAEVARLRLLHTITVEFNASLDFDEVLTRVFDRVVSAVEAQGGSIWIAEGDVLRCRLVRGKASRKLLDTTVPLESVSVSGNADKTLTRMTTGFVALTAMRSAMVTEGVVVGSVEMLNKTTDPDGIFDHHDRELLDALALTAARALRNAQLHAAASQARDLGIVLEISREITATLDLDRVLQSVVNLAGKALPLDQAAIGIFSKGECEIRAIAGEETVDAKADRTMRLAACGERIARNGDAFYLSDRESPATDAEVSFVNLFGGELEQEGVRSGYYLPLKDEQGVLGVLLFESRQPDFLLPRQRELAQVLANQATVALRNAELYAQVPMVDAFGALAAKKRALLAMPRARMLTYVAVAVLALASVTLIRWPLRIGGIAPEFRATMFTPVHTLVPGVVERVMVREGATVARAAPVAKLRDAQLVSERTAALAAAAAADQMAASADARGNASDARAQRARSAAFRQDVALVDEQIAATTIRAPVSGIVLTSRPEERVGTSLAAGDVVVSLGRTDSLELQFGVDQRDVQRVSPDARVRVRVDALPQQTFEGRVTFLSPVPADVGNGAYFMVRAVVDNAHGLLKPGMAAHARVLATNASVVERVFRGPIRWLRLTWWRVFA